MADIREIDIPFGEFHTHCRIVEGKDEGKLPLILLHGGPGSCHDTLEVLDPMADAGRTLIYYDQLGCGLSPCPDERTDLFDLNTWCAELNNIVDKLKIDRFHLLGHSCGGMLAITYISDFDSMEGAGGDLRLKGRVASAVLSSTLPSSQLWSEETHRLITHLPEDVQRVLLEAERTGDYSSPEYLEAYDRYCRSFIGPRWGEDAPDCLRRPKKTGTAAYMTAWGPNEFTPAGNMKDWDYLDRMRSWDLPVLITSGIDDESTPYINLQMHGAVKGSKWVLFRHSRHMSYAEENPEYIRVVSEFLDSHDR